MDALTSVLYTFGFVLLISSWIYLIIIAFKDDFAWGMVTIFFAPFSYLYGIKRWNTAKDALFMGAIGIALILLGLF